MGLHPDGSGRLRSSIICVRGLGRTRSDVTRAELTAFSEALRGTPCHICVVSDSAYVVNVFAKLQKGSFL